MNYQKIYDNLVENAKSQDREKLSKEDSKYIYYERHHIIPKSLGGNNEDKNLVLLTAREHFIAHKLLVNIYPKIKRNGFSYSFYDIWSTKKIIKFIFSRIS